MVLGLGDSLNMRSFWKPTKRVKRPARKGFSAQTLNVMGIWPGKAEGHCIMQLPIYWGQYI